MLTLVLVAGFAAGCGKKGDPMPPFRAVPAAVDDLEIRQQGRDFVLEFGYPNTSASGGVLPGIESIEVLKLLKAPAAEGFELKVEARELAGVPALATLRGGDLAAATSGNRVYLRLPVGREEVEAGKAHAFAVRSTASNGEESGLSNVVHLVPAEPPEPPRDLAVIPGAGGVEVRWTPPEGAVDSFNVYRRDARSRTYRSPTANVKADRTSHLDRSARFGDRYIYTVTTVGSREPLIESRLSGEAEVLYQDRFPPAPPSGLVALAETDQVRLRWNASSSPDVTGYHVYRKDDGDFRRLTRRSLEARELTDERVRPGRTYTYRVTAVDSLGNEGEPGVEVTTTVR